MGKRKQQKLYQLNNKPNKEKKQEINSILKGLAAFKQQKVDKAVQNNRPIDIVAHNKKIKKQQKLKKTLQKKKKRNDQQVGSQEQAVKIPPKVNIFAVDDYQSGVKTVINNRDSAIQTEDSHKLQNETKKMMGDLTFQTFGQKPLKIIEQEQRVELSQDEDQPNTVKNITHPNLAIPSGSYRFQRNKKIQQIRQKLPIYMKEQQIIETINQHIVTLICGETGSGKSTQIPQFLIQKQYHQFGKIAITQPRRLATIALANRIAQQTGSKIGQIVGYQVRHQRKQAPTNLIKFMTDGILLNEMSSDYLLSAYGVIVIDEAHQRKVNTDILIGLLSRLVLQRYKLSLQGKAHPLRLVIMSATMRIQDFENTVLFNFKVPIINVQARMFAVTIYYQKQTPEDYKAAAVKKCVSIHRKLPPGDVLVFLTGKEEIHEVAVMLQSALGRQQIEQEEGQSQMQMEKQVDNPPEMQNEQSTNRPKSYVIHCLYSSLPLNQQQVIFKSTPPQCRKFVISTNIAQTSITIPNIRYVIDSGQEKHRYHQGIWKWRKGWGSRAMAQQRSGRAGRTTHGYCYRLYSSALYANIMDEYPLPEISKLPLQGVILQLVSIGISKVLNFPFPTAPPRQKVQSTLSYLLQLKAIQKSEGSSLTTNKIGQQSVKITEMGKVLSYLPVDPKLGKMLLMGRKLKVQKHTLLMVILMTVQSIFLDQNYELNVKSRLNQDDLKGMFLQEMRTKSKSFRNNYKPYIMQGHYGDIFTCINIMGHFFTQLYQKQGSIHQKIVKLSSQLQLNQNTMRQVYFNTDQIAEIYQTLCEQKIQFSTYVQPNHSQCQKLLDILLDAYVNNLCRLQAKNKYKNKSEQAVHIHFLSDIYLKDNLFLGCAEFYANQQGKNYMRYPFPVKNYELLASYGTVNPVSQFGWREGRIVGLSTGTIFSWQIPNLFIEDVPQNVKYFYVAKYLLEGKVFQQLKVLQKYYIAPVNIIKPGNLDYKVQKLVQALRVNKIDSLVAIKDLWSKDKQFLKKQLALWVNMNNFEQVYQKIRLSALKTSNYQ